MKKKTGAFVELTGKNKTRQVDKSSSNGSLCILQEKLSILDKGTITARYYTTHVRSLNTQ